jgi:hypothetical protein
MRWQKPMIEKIFFKEMIVPTLWDFRILLSFMPMAVYGVIEDKYAEWKGKQDVTIK